MIEQSNPDRAVIQLNGIKGIGHHGVLDEEKSLGQPFIADVILEVAEPHRDDISQAVNYADVAQQVYDEITGDPVDLIETLAARIADSCLAHAGVIAVQVCVHKPQAPIAVPFDDVSVTVNRRAS